MKQMLINELKEKGVVTLIAEAITVVVLAPVCVIGLIILSEYIK